MRCWDIAAVLSTDQSGSAMGRYKHISDVFRETHLAMDVVPVLKFLQTVALMVVLVAVGGTDGSPCGGIKSSCKALVSPNLIPHAQQDREWKQASTSRTVLALNSRSNPLRIKAEQLFKQGREQIAIVKVYAGMARSAKLDMMRQIRIFDEQAESYTELLGRSEFKALLRSSPVDEDILHRFERELKQRYKYTRQAVSDAKELFDSQLRIQKLKDTIFQVNDQFDQGKEAGSLFQSHRSQVNLEGPPLSYDEADGGADIKCAGLRDR